MNTTKIEDEARTALGRGVKQTVTLHPYRMDEIKSVARDLGTFRDEAIRLTLHLGLASMRERLAAGDSLAELREDALGHARGWAEERAAAREANRAKIPPQRGPKAKGRGARA